MSKQLIVTHHAPDLDAVASTWLLKKFDQKKYADAKISFVNPGETISLDRANELGFELHNVVHVDTGLGRFDHHQPERGKQRITATSLVYDYLISLQPTLEKDEALAILVDFVTQVDHFEEIYWPEAESYRYSFMIHDLIRGIEFSDPHNDDSQMQFGLQALNYAYASLVQQVKAREIITQKGESFEFNNHGHLVKSLAISTRNDDTLKIAQKQGYELVVRKDSKKGHIRIKVRPDSNIVLNELYKVVISKDHQATWFYHQSGKMLINGSRKHNNQKPSSLSLNEIVTLIKETLTTK